MVYFDGVHLIADTLEELHSFANQCGLKRKWFQDNPKHPHYDVLGQKNIKKVKKFGAKEVGSKEIINILKQNKIMEYPKENELWKIDHGNPQEIVKIIEDKKILDPSKWKEKGFKCLSFGKVIYVNGDCFIEKIV